MHFKVDDIAEMKRPRKSWLECVNDEKVWFEQRYGIR